MDGRKNDPKSLAMFLSAMLIFGSVGVFRRQIQLPSAFLALSRGFLGGLSVLAFTRLTGKGTGGKLPPRQMRLLVFSGAAMGVNWILLFEAYNRTTVAIATLCYYMQPTIVMLLSPAIFREKLTGGKAACAAAAIAGMILVSGVAGEDGRTGGNLHGILLGLGAAVFYSAVVILNKKTGGTDPYRKTTVQLLSAGAVMIPYVLLTGAGFGADEFSVTAVLLVLVMGFIHTGIAYLLYFGSMDGLRVQSIAILSYVDPVSALLFSALFLKEPLHPAGILGALLVIGSAVLSEIPAKRTKG